MTDPERMTSALVAARDAFKHAHGEPRFESTINAGQDADAGEVQIQKACRLLEAAEMLDDAGGYYGSVLEHAFAVIERTLEGYLIHSAGYEIVDFRDHTAVYERARHQAPLTTDTLDMLEVLYDDRRTKHYYGTTVTTARQAQTMMEVADVLHDHLIQFEPDLVRFCNCG